MEQAWASGLFEGEGSIEESVASRAGRPRLQLKMIHESSVRRFRAAVGAGRVYGPYGPYSTQMGSTPYFLWTATGDEAAKAAAAIQPWVSEPWASRLAAIAKE